MRTKILITAIAAVLAVLPGCKKDVSKQQRPPVKVQAIAVAPGAEDGEREFSATIEAGSETPLSFTTPGTIRSISVEAGQKVQKGQVIATIDDTSLRNTLNIALAEEEQALDAERRMKILHDAKALAEIKWVDIQAKVKQAKAATAIARKALGDAVLRSPLSGVVGQKMAQPGQTAIPGMPIVTVLSGGAPQARVSIPENEIAALQVGQLATVVCDALDKATFEARLTEKGVQADPMSRAYTVKFKIANPSPQLLPGMVCTVKTLAVTNEPNNDIVLPIDAVALKDDNSKMVWVIIKGVAQPRNVTVGDLTDQGVLITSGLNPGDSVITQGWQDVGAGTHVEVVNQYGL